jgi:hypothetical protein
MSTSAAPTALGEEPEEEDVNGHEQLSLSGRTFRRKDARGHLRAHRESRSHNNSNVPPILLEEMSGVAGNISNSAGLNLEGPTLTHTRSRNSALLSPTEALPNARARKQRESISLASYAASTMGSEGTEVSLRSSRPHQHHQQQHQQNQLPLGLTRLATEASDTYVIEEEKNNS